MATGDFKLHPTQGEVPQIGFSSERGGSLRDHNGCCADPKAIAATEHYDGDYGISRLNIAKPKPQPAGAAPVAQSKYQDILGVRG